METRIADVIVPEVFLPYLIERTAALSELITSGIIENSPQFDNIVTNEGGYTVQMPFWQDLAGDDEIVTESTGVTVGKIGASKDIARRQVRAKAWGAHDLAGILAGDDPMMAIADLMAAYRARRLQAQVLATLQGVFAAASMSGSVLSIAQTSGSATSANYLTGTSFIDGGQLLGDAKSKLQAVIMHSAVEASLRKLDLIDYIPDSQGSAMLATFQGKRIIVDDGMPVDVIDSKNAYTTYLFGSGAIALGWSGKNDEPEGGEGTWQVEFGRDPLVHTSYVINRWSNILHPRGVKWLEASVAAEFPTNAELAIGTNWERVYEQKNIRIVKVQHNIA
jgi:hypothetical protein